ncbi:uncharacterized protein VTP21DRAFT_707 [Calcarisporiella thermophila]|uniref:uncharacterized protein n=1 Tax=Calcarisporiella thermophila TaxID=911321 RepID=UPI003742A322
MDPKDRLHRTTGPRIARKSHRFSKQLIAALTLSEEERQLLELAGEGDAEAVKKLLESSPPPKVDCQDSKLRTPLLIACSGGKADVVRVLLQYGAEVNEITDLIGNRPLDLAVISNSAECVLLLLEAGARVDSMSKRSPLSLAQSRLQLLLSRNDAMHDEGNGWEAAAENGSLKQVLMIAQILRWYLISSSSSRRLLALPAPSPITPHSKASSPFTSSLISTLDDLTIRLSQLACDESNLLNHQKPKEWREEVEEFEEVDGEEVPVISSLGRRRQKAMEKCEAAKKDPEVGNAVARRGGGSDSHQLLMQLQDIMDSLQKMNV